MAFARLSNLYTSLALSADASLRVTRTLESWTPYILWDNACSIGDNPFILPKLKLIGR